MSVVSVALSHYRERERLVRGVDRVASRAWRRVDPGDIAASWTALLPAVLAALIGAQRLAATPADAYLGAALAEQGLPAAAEGRVVADALTGVASDGRDLASLLYRPVVTSLVAIQGGTSTARALAGGEAALRMIVGTQVADAGRAADQVALAARPAVTGYRRMLVGRSCSRCVILAGRWYRYNQGFNRHPRCFPAGVTVSGPPSEAATRRLYQGELVVLATASGQKLPLTGNHPVLTCRGWIPARLLKEGDEVVRSTRPEGATALVVPHHDQMPARIEDVWGSLGVPILDAMESSPEDFHGDGQHGKVDIVRADRPLNGRLLAALAQHGPQFDFSSAAGAAFTLDGQRSAELLDLRDAPLAGGLVGLDGLSLPLFGGQGFDPDAASFADTASLYPGDSEDAGDRATRDAVLLCESVFASSSEVGSNDCFSGQADGLARWDAPGDAFSVETRDGYAARGRDLLQRLAGQVELDRVVEVRRVEWSGHVYSLTSSEGWHSANSLIVSNCDCTHVPAREDTGQDVTTSPKRYFDSLSRAEQDRAFTKAGAEAIRLGADITQVVNARRGMSTAGPPGRRRLVAVDVHGQQVYVTSEGITTRGVASRRLGARETGTRAGGGRYRSARVPRLMPETILAVAEDREDAVRLLRRHGYIT